MKILKNCKINRKIMKNKIFDNKKFSKIANLTKIYKKFNFKVKP